MAGGKGSRMGTASKHKSTFDIAGVPAIVRLLRGLRTAGIDLNVVVVGALGDQVMDVVSRHVPGVAFVHQHEQRGTGHAAKIGLRFLNHAGFDGDVLVVPGDAHVDPGAIQQLVTGHRARDATLSLMVKEKEHAPRSGRVVMDDTGRVLASVEYWDIQRAIARNAIVDRLATLDASAPAANSPEAPGKDFLTGVQAILRSIVPDAAKAMRIFPEVSRAITSGLDAPPGDPGAVQAAIDAIRHAVLTIPPGFTIGGRVLDPAALERDARVVNVSVYLCKAAAAYQHAERILSANAQNEEYLTDIIQLVAETGQRVVAVPLRSPNDVMSFNTPDELVRVNEHVSMLGKGKQATARAPGITRPVHEWIRGFRDRAAWITSRMDAIYGQGYARAGDKMAHYIAALEGFAGKFPDDPDALVVRAPGRINLMGRHVDHRGGDVNMLAIDAEVIMVAAPREDDLIVAYNASPADHPARAFSIADTLSMVPWTDWFDFISNQKVNEMIRDSRGDWVNYLKAAALRYQVAVPDVALKGANVFVLGTIPQAAGLSSSSALVVAMLECLSAVNGLPLEPREFIDVCGEGEWFVGTRGGSSDHAAIKASERGKVTRIGFFPFTIKELATFPPGIEVLVINSMRKACKSAGELQRFNSRVLAYEIGFKLLVERFPQHEHRLQHLRDVSASQLGIASRDIYTMLQQVPETIDTRDLDKMLHASAVQQLEARFPGLRETGPLVIRPVVVFGIAECHRSAMAMARLQTGDVEGFGKLMNTSHDGDRVATFTAFDPAATPAPFNVAFTDGFLRAAHEQDTPLETVPGGYACSIPEIDFIVDLLWTFPGVLGAQISGAGLGGCVMALVRSDHATAITTKLASIYTARWCIEPDIISTTPILGAGLFDRVA